MKKQNFSKSLRVYKTYNHNEFNIILYLSTFWNVNFNTFKLHKVMIWFMQNIYPLFFIFTIFIKRIKVLWHSNIVCNTSLKRQTLLKWPELKSLKIKYKIVLTKTESRNLDHFIRRDRLSIKWKVSMAPTMQLFLTKCIFYRPRREFNKVRECAIAGSHSLLCERCTKLNFVFFGNVYRICQYYDDYGYIYT